MTTTHATKFFDGLADSLLPSKEEREWLAQQRGEPGHVHRNLEEIDDDGFVRCLDCGETLRY